MIFPLFQSDLRRKISSNLFYKILSYEVNNKRKEKSVLIFTIALLTQTLEAF